MEQLRGIAIRPRIDFDCCSIMKRYYSQLHSLQNRFPLSSENELIDFAWKDIYSGSIWRSSNIKYEMASILYNIAALHSKLGVEEPRTDSESMKIACTHFQCAAWAFGEIKNQYALVLKGDLLPELMIFMQQICFAQAQECILEKSLADNRKAAIIAKVTAQVITFYNAALSALFSQNEDGTVADLVANKLYKEWLKYIKFKTSYMSSILFLHQGMNSEEQRKMGERVALYNAACEKLEEARKESKGMNQIELTNEVLTFAGDIIEGKFKNAKQENEFIYHEAIPDISSISAVQGANLVQGISFEVIDTQIIGEDIFKRLVPMKTHENLSVYSEEKANILRNLGAKIDGCDAELASFMGSLNTESLNSIGQSQSKLPQGLIDRCAELSANPNAISDLVESMSKLADVSCDVEITLKEIKKILDDEADQEQIFQNQIGKRPMTGHMTELNREYTKYLEGHNKAGESNDTLRKAMELHVKNLRILAQPLSLLKSEAPQADPVDKVTIEELQTLLNKVEEMKKQRDGLFNNLREQILNKDDITAQLIAHGDKDVEDLFQRELKKYSHSVSIIEQNLVAQGNILKALTETYAKHAMTLKSYNDTKLKREQFYSSLVASFDVYEDLMSKSAKGLDFYKKLHANVQKLMSRVKAARDVQEEERQQLLKNSLAKTIPAESSKAVDSIHKSKGKVYNTKLSVIINEIDFFSVLSSSGGPKLKNYVRSGTVPGTLLDDFSKLPAVRPSPLGQENASFANPAPCQSMGYSANYRIQPESSYPNHQIFPHYPTNSQLNINSGIASPSSSSTSFSSEYYNQRGIFGPMSGNQGYVNPIYQKQTEKMNLSNADINQTDASKDKSLVYNSNTNHHYGADCSQQQRKLGSQQHEYYINQGFSARQSPTVHDIYHSVPLNLDFNATATNDSQMNLINVQPQQTTYELEQSYRLNQYQVLLQYPSISASSTTQSQQHLVSRSSHPQNYPDTQISNISQYSGAKNYQNQNSIPQLNGSFLENQTTAMVPQISAFQVPKQNTSVSLQQTGYKYPNQVPNVISQDYGNNQTYFNHNSSNVCVDNLYGEHLSQQNYACYTPTINSMSSYMTAGDDHSGHSDTTQSANYSQTPDVLQSHVHMVNRPIESPQRQPHSIPTYSAAVNATATNNSEMQVTQSRHQISSSIETNQKSTTSKQTERKSSNIDLLSSIDFTLTNSTIGNVPTLKPVSITEKKEVSEHKLKQVSEPKEKSAAEKLNEDLTDLDFSSITPITRQEALPLKNEKQISTVDGFEDTSILKQFHKEVESLEKFMESLTVRTLNGFTPLASKWKELQDLLKKDEPNRSVSVARLFPEKNRSVDFLPYDHARVLLSSDPTTTDNYINAVYVKDCGSVAFILTQTPMVNTVNDYWEMVWSQKSTILICLHSPNEVSSTKIHDTK